MSEDKSQQAEEIKSTAKEEFRFNVVVWFKQKREREGVVVAIMNALNWFDEKSSVLISDSHSSKEDAGQRTEEKIQEIAVGVLQWVLHRFVKTEYDKETLKWKWNQTLWSSQEMFELYIEEEEIDYNIPGVSAGQQGEDAGYWKKRCEAAERIVAISGVVNCDGYDYWQSLKNQQ